MAVPTEQGLCCRSSYSQLCIWLSTLEKVRTARLLCHGLGTDFLTVPCSGDHKHVKIEGKLTKPSAIYVPKPAKHFAIAFATAVRAKAVEKRRVRLLASSRSLQMMC